jgi:hypothetical protein
VVWKDHVSGAYSVVWKNHVTKRRRAIYKLARLIRREVEHDCSRISLAGSDK